MTISNSEIEADISSINPHKRLVAAILERTMFDLFSDCPKLKLEAYNWFFNEPFEDEYFSFQSICEHLDLHLESIRRELLGYLQAKERG